MSLRVVGAGLGRTGTNSLKVALEQLLGGRCYHMVEVFGRPADIGRWQDAVDGKPVDWLALMEEFSAAVDWPVCAFWPEIADAFPDAIVLLSTRCNSAEWWKSANDTIFAVTQLGEPPDGMLAAQRRMIQGLFDRFTPNWKDRNEAMRAYDRHNDAVRAAVAPGRLVEWQPGDGWEPLCAALGIPVPDAEFPHTNTTGEFRAMVGLD
ncbi:MAG TPA: sulfotransferase [Acidimicrobiia bacterium]|jgi:hypothetical protein|nr:sulfotransferase [Acidimicrobiia bacterium]